ncbi:uncharacterized protein TNCV_3513731 [Trichonephila clavipes]|nr:uncharacterized protein TNCV_3513731 [Trichonephila clavipes]
MPTPAPWPSTQDHTGENPWPETPYRDAPSDSGLGLSQVNLLTGENVPLKTRRVGQRCTLNLSRAETSSRWCGVVVRRGVPAQVSSTSLDHGSKLRGPSPKALV